jgi:hypothetical protein
MNEFWCGQINMNEFWCGQILSEILFSYVRRYWEMEILHKWLSLNYLTNKLLGHNDDLNFTTRPSMKLIFWNHGSVLQ